MSYYCNFVVHTTSCFGRCVVLQFCCSHNFIFLADVSYCNSVVHTTSFVGRCIVLRFGCSTVQDFYLSLKSSPGQNFQAELQESYDRHAQTYLRTRESRPKQISPGWYILARQNMITCLCIIAPDTKLSIFVSVALMQKMTTCVSLPRIQNCQFLHPWHSCSFLTASLNFKGPSLFFFFPSQYLGAMVGCLFVPHLI